MCFNCLKGYDPELYLFDLLCNLRQIWQKKVGFSFSEETEAGSLPDHEIDMFAFADFFLSYLYGESYLSFPEYCFDKEDLERLYNVECKLEKEYDIEAFKVIMVFSLSQYERACKNALDTVL